MRWAFKIAYIGRLFHGYQRQPGLRTVEGELLRALLKGGIVDDPKACRLRCASRTDRGVSALGNVVSFDTNVHPKKVISTVNAKLEGIWLYAYRSVPDEFNPRRARERWYRYHLRKDLPIDQLAAGARAFLGRRDFARLAKEGPAMCDVRAIECTRVNEWTVIDVRADRFARNMVRRMVRALELYCEGVLDLDELKALVKVGGPRIEPAPPEYLWLVDVAYDFPFEAFLPRTALDRLREALSLGCLEERLLTGLLERL